jgi:hypothetical protein
MRRAADEEEDQSLKNVRFFPDIERAETSERLESRDQQLNVSGVLFLNFRVLDGSFGTCVIRVNDFKLSMARPSLYIFVTWNDGYEDGRMSSSARSVTIYELDFSKLGFAIEWSQKSTEIAVQ